MSPIVSSTQQLIGQTPLLELRRLREHLHLPARLLAKVESFNVAGSVKDRVALAILNQAEKDLAQELFYQALQEADAIMRQNKRLAHQEHYTLVQTYIEQQLKQPISLHDRRLF